MWLSTNPKTSSAWFRNNQMKSSLRHQDERAHANQLEDRQQQMQSLHPRSQCERARPRPAMLLNRLRSSNQSKPWQSMSHNHQQREPLRARNRPRRPRETLEGLLLSQRCLNFPHRNLPFHLNQTKDTLHHWPTSPPKP